MINECKALLFLNPGSKTKNKDVLCNVGIMILLKYLEYHEMYYVTKVLCTNLMLEVLVSSLLFLFFSYLNFNPVHCVLFTVQGYYF